MKSPAEIASTYENIGTSKTQMNFRKTFLLAILAGAFIAMGGLGSQIASACAPDPSLARLISSVVFPIGLFMVLVGGAELFAGKVFALWLPIMLFIIGGFEHCVANMYFIPAGMIATSVYGIAADGLSLFGFLITNLLPVTLGNIIGGVLCVGTTYYLIYQ